MSERLENALSQMLSNLSEFAWEKTSTKEFTIPHVTLRKLADIRTRDRKKLLASFRKNEPVYQQRLREEAQGAQLILTPIVEFYLTSQRSLVPASPAKPLIEAFAATPFGYTSPAKVDTQWFIAAIQKQQSWPSGVSSNFDQHELVLRLLEVALERSVLLIYRPEMLRIPGVKSRAQLISCIATQWSTLRHQAPFAQCAGKREVLGDLNDQAFASLTACDAESIYSIIDLTDCQKRFPTIFEDVHPMLMGLICQSRGFKKAATFFFRRASSHPVSCETVESFCSVTGIPESPFESVASVPSNSRYVLSTFRGLPLVRDDTVLFSQQPAAVEPVRKIRRPMVLNQAFMEKGELPDGLTYQQGGIAIAKTQSVLQFSWYKQQSGMIDVERLFEDACRLQRNGPPKWAGSGGGRCTLGEFCQAYGLQLALDRFVSIVQTDCTYPDDIVPIFDLTAIEPETQYQAHQIHLATGRFGDHIIGYRNEKEDFCLMLSDVCPIARHDGSLSTTRFKKGILDDVLWLPGDFITRFSPKDFCLLQVALFCRLIVPDSTTTQSIFNTGLRVKASDLEMTQHSQERTNVSMSTLLSIAQESGLLGDTVEALHRYLRLIASHTGAYLCFNSDQSICYEQTHQLLCGEYPNWSSVVSVDVSVGDFRRWIQKQARGRSTLVPRLPCIVRMRQTQQEGKLVSFDTASNCWTIWDADQLYVFDASKQEFDVLESRRCLPAPVMSEDGDPLGVAIELIDRDRGLYWISGDDGARIKMTLGTEFIWAQSAFVASSDSRDEDRDYQFSLCENEDNPECFDTDGNMKYNEMGEDEPVPEMGCQDWLLVSYFGPDGIGKFVKFMGLEVTNTTLYQAYDESPRDQFVIQSAAKWLWNRLETFTYRRMVWFTALNGLKHNDETFTFVINKLY